MRQNWRASNSIGPQDDHHSYPVQSRSMRYLQTLRYLQPVQVYGRLWFKLYRPGIDQSAPPPLREASGEWREPAVLAASMQGRGICSAS